MDHAGPRTKLHHLQKIDDGHVGEMTSKRTWIFARQELSRSPIKKHPAASYNLLDEDGTEKKIVCPQLKSAETFTGQILAREENNGDRGVFATTFQLGTEREPVELG